MDQPMDKGVSYAEHFTPQGDWKPGDLDYFTVPQNQFTDEEHDVWRTLYRRQLDVLPGRAIELFMDSLSTLGIRQDGIPDFNEVNDILMKRTGWQVVAVPGLIPEEPFFELLANRRFPAGNFIRTREQLDYIQEPDVFHDVFGHVPILAEPVFADYMEAYGKGGLRAAKLGTTNKLARLYWYTVEFGLTREFGKTQIYGAGILSSPTESVFSLDSPSPNRVKFDLNRVLQSHYQIDDFQDTYFVIDSFQQLFDDTYADFGPVYDALKGKPVIPPGVLTDTDVAYTKGTGEYAREAQARRDARKTK